jgi:hypothetical protein
MENKDIQLIKKEFSIFFRPTDTIELKEGSFTCSETFIETFPKLHKLLSFATVADVTLTRKQEQTQYRRYSWNNSTSWLCKIETDKTSVKILPEHQLLLDNMGGIQESNRVDSETEILTDNQNFLFIGSECFAGLDADWDEFYKEACEDEGVKPIDTKNFVCFVTEANGNETYYDLQTKKVYLFATDHCFENVKELNNQPEYTFYTINKVKTFVDYVEVLAKQWLNIAK